MSSGIQLKLSSWPTADVTVEAAAQPPAADQLEETHPLKQPHRELDTVIVEEREDEDGEDAAGVRV